jgi:hypothetical protein
LTVERAVSVATLGLPTDDVGADVVRELNARNLPTVSSLEAKYVITTGLGVEPYVEARDYDQLAKRTASKGMRPTNAKRRVRWRQQSKDRLLLSVADQKAVDNTAQMLTRWGCKPWIIADPSLVWLETFAQNGIIDDLDGTTLFAMRDAQGTIQSDTAFEQQNIEQFQTAAVTIIRRAAISAPIEALAYFGPATRYARLRPAIVGMGINLVPALPPHHNTSEAWTYALALATYGACS